MSSTNILIEIGSGIVAGLFVNLSSLIIALIWVVTFFGITSVLSRQENKTEMTDTEGCFQALKSIFVLVLGYFSALIGGYLLSFWLAIKIGNSKFYFGSYYDFSVLIFSLIPAWISFIQFQNDRKHKLGSESK
ncbi:hypothetical protein PCC7418_2299 [Halothece sp. PCC 7418]|uniref:hypothetical protein n=1 Tax=Halothece sp. (strain PCC 7418) TaxID=65093 RepID=UPI0002A07E5E|nr:hypothetical protein [Halothece sp. PCC 7418]AFZ44449.1 hypothetical protein PCC7418_2299 [Halothece sp. PCC 7418]